MLTLKSLEFQNIGRFVDPQTIDFTQLGSLVQVDAQNLNTGGSSGAGKSTIFKALEFLLGLNDISNGVLQSRLTKESMSVTGLFDLDGQSLRIERGKKLLIDLNGEITTGSSKITEERLDQIIGMPRDLFRKILHKRQGEGGFFLDLGGAETHKFLTVCLGLQNEQNKTLVLDTRLHGLSAMESTLKSTTESYKSALEATKTARDSLGEPPALEILPEAIEELKTKHSEAIETYRLTKMFHKKEMEALEKERPQVVSTSFDRSNIERIEKEIDDCKAKIYQLEKIEQNRLSEIKVKISELKNLSSKLENSEQTRQSEVRSRLNSNKLETTKTLYLVNDGNKAKEEAIRLVEELKKVRASICPTCEQQWITDAAKSKETTILQKLQEYKKLVIIGMEADKKIKVLEEERKGLDLESTPKPILEILEIENKINALHQEARSAPNVDKNIEFSTKWESLSRQNLVERVLESDHQSKENAKMQAILSDFTQKQNALRHTQLTLEQHLQKEEEKATLEYMSAKNKAKSYEEAKKRFQESFDKLILQSIKYQEQLTEKLSELAQTQEEIELAQESKKVIKSYLSASFEDALESIGDAATKFIRSIPNMSTATIQFEGLKENKDGKIKEEVTCLVSMDGEIGVPIKSLSGGERSSTDLAIDLSVIKFIEERTGKGIDLFVLDEPFTGLDSKNILEALEMLRECSTEKRLLIVDHNPEASQSIENRLTVIRDGLTSKVVQQ